MAELLESLKHAPQQMFSIPVSMSELPFRTGAFSQANIDSTGHLILMSEDGNLEIKDLTETKNRDLMMAVIGDIVPKFKDFADQIAEEKLQEPPQVQEVPPPEPIHPTPVEEEVPVELPDVDAPSVQEEAPVELPSSEVESVPEEVPVLAADEKAKIEEITAETLNDLETLGNEVFNQSPVSVYFDDWLVHLRQVILGFESSDVISVDEAFTDECEQIFRDIEEELANRLLKEAELEQQRIRDEYQKKKQTTLKKVQTLEKEIATKRTDNSVEARKAATKALANAVKSLIQRNTEPTKSSN